MNWLRALWALALVAVFAGCTPVEPVSIRSGLGAGANLNALRPPSGVTYRYAFENAEFPAPGVMTIRSRRINGTQMRYRGSVAMPVRDIGGAEPEVLKSFNQFFADLGLRFENGNLLFDVDITTDNRFRSTNSTLLGQSASYTPHDCFGVLGACDYVVKGPDGQDVRILVETSETGGVWRALLRADPKTVSGSDARQSSTHTYSIDRNGVMLDLVIDRNEGGKRDRLVVRRK